MKEYLAERVLNRGLFLYVLFRVVYEVHRVSFIAHDSSSIKITPCATILF